LVTLCGAVAFICVEATFGSVRFKGPVIFANFGLFKFGTIGIAPLKRPFPRFVPTVGMTPEKRAFGCPTEEVTPEKLASFCTWVLSLAAVNPKTNIAIEITTILLKINCELGN
jgi:hypothetical protein